MKESRSENVARLSRSRRLQLIEEHAGDLAAAAEQGRPATRGECEGGPRPCPFVGCAHNTFLNVNEDTGTILFEQGAKEPWEVDPETSCALDVADRGGVTLKNMGGVLGGLTRERIRQIEAKALASLRRKGVTKLLDGFEAHERPPTAWEGIASSHGGAVTEYAKETRSQRMPKELTEEEQREVDAWVDERYAALGLPDPLVIERAVPGGNMPGTMPTMTEEAIEVLRDKGPLAHRKLAQEMHCPNENSLRTTLHKARVDGKVRNVATDEGTVWYLPGQTPPGIEEDLPPADPTPPPPATRRLDEELAPKPTLLDRVVEQVKEHDGVDPRLPPPPPPVFDKEARTLSAVPAAPSSQPAASSIQAAVARARRRRQLAEALDAVPSTLLVEVLEELVGLDALEELAKLR